MFKPKTNLALMIMHTLVTHDRPMQIQELSKSIGYSQSYIEQVLARLRAGNLVKAKRGLNGGYTLTLKPEQYTVSMILEAMLEPAPDIPMFQNILYDLSATYLMHLETCNNIQAA